LSDDSHMSVVLGITIMTSPWYLKEYFGEAKIMFLNNHQRWPFGYKHVIKINEGERDGRS